MNKPDASHDNDPQLAAERAVADLPALAARSITKAFPGVVANDRVTLEVRSGEVHALLGENGSGKTTLCKILTGLYRPDAGTVAVNGRDVEFRSPADAYAAGVFMVHQHFSLVGQMTVAENVVLGWSQHRSLRFDRRRVEDEVARAAREYHVEIDPGAWVWQLSAGERQRVEILKALYRNARILILDEPTTVLTPQEVERLFASIRRMAESGGSVVFISHKLHEVVAVCDRVTVLRDGRVSGAVDLRSREVDPRELARLMVGREIALSRRVRRPQDGPRVPRLEMRGLIARNDWGRDVVQDVSLDVHAGEIVGVAGVAGNGQRELADVICGLRRRVAGEILVDGRDLPPGDARAAIERGIAYVPEDRNGVGLVPGLTVGENLMVKTFRSRRFSAGPFVRRQRVHEHAQALIASFDVKGSPRTLARQLSGGNAQRVLLARETSSKPGVLVVAAPTQGLDIAATAAVRELLVHAAESGAAVLMISEDLEEILDLADRVAVMCHGSITGIVEAQSARIEEIGLMMMGHRPEQ